VPAIGDHRASAMAICAGDISGTRCIRHAASAAYVEDAFG
jgi:hypothetical protein